MSQSDPKLPSSIVVLKPFINPELNVEQEMKRVRDKWKASVDELRIKK